MAIVTVNNTNIKIINYTLKTKNRLIGRKEHTTHTSLALSVRDGGIYETGPRLYTMIMKHSLGHAVLLFPGYSTRENHANQRPRKYFPLSKSHSDRGRCSLSIVIVARTNVYIFFPGNVFIRKNKEKMPNTAPMPCNAISFCVSQISPWNPRNARPAPGSPMMPTTNSPTS